MYKFIDLFSGVGGFHLAFNGLAECVYAAEWDKYARITYSLNHRPNGNEFPFDEDITKVDVDKIPAHDILCAGFPCQPFSIAGRQQGFSHPTQGTLFYNIIKIIQKHNPSVVFLENVKNLKTHDNGNTYNKIIKSLEDEEYTVNDDVLNASDYNIPQNRERIYIIAFKNPKQSSGFNFPEKVIQVKTISDILINESTEQIDDIFYQTNLNSPSIKMMHDGINKDGSLGDKVEKENTIYQYRRYYIRENKQNVCPTLTANMGTGGHNVPLIKTKWGIRKLTPRECFRFQGYPNVFKLPDIANSHLYKQAGNSIPYTVIKMIATNIIKTFDTNTWNEPKFHEKPEHNLTGAGF